MTVNVYVSGDELVVEGLTAHLVIAMASQITREQGRVVTIGMPRVKSVERKENHYEIR